MDIFIEKIVKKQIESIDYVIMFVIIAGAVFAVFFSFSLIPSPMISMLVAAGLIYGSYRLITGRNLEYEYIVTNGELDVDVIINRSRRKRIFNGKSSEFEIMAKMNSDKYTDSYKTIEKKIKSVSTMISDKIYFIVTRYKEQKVIIFFEPDERILKNLRMYNKKNIFI